jgi:hypothetical protein
VRFITGRSEENPCGKGETEGGSMWIEIFYKKKKKVQ